MKTQDAIAWFKRTFGNRIADGLRGTPFSVDLVTAIATQETCYIWSSLVAKGLSEPDVLSLCVGDTLDADKGRDAFPRTRADLLAAPRGTEMFAIARQAAVDMARQIPGYNFVFGNQNKFCHGFGIFQYDIQFFKTNPDWFLGKRWAEFGACLAQLLVELKEALARQHWSGKTTLTDTEQIFVAIAYNRGTADPARGFKQGYESDGRYYGENIQEYLRIAQGTEAGGTAPSPPRGQAPLPSPTPFDRIGEVYEVQVQEAPLRLRSEPRIPKDDENANVIARLPDGQLVQRVAKSKKTGEFLEVETSLNGAYYRGFASGKLMRRVPRAKKVGEAKKVSRTKKAKVGAKKKRPSVAAPPQVEVPTPAPVEPTSGIVAVYMPRKPGTITRRADPAGPHSLNEAGQPGRQGASAAERCAELAAIIDWLAVDDPDHERYQPRRGSTFCNIYTHDYTYLAGAYLPRVWWMPGAIERLARGETVEPLYENTIDEQRANDLFRWLRDFGLRFGWRQTGTLTKLQDAANLGGLGIIVARRKEDGKSGHIVAVVPETADFGAKRDPAGNVIAPLQSQAGSVNFRYRASPNEWWRGEQFADSAFWIHA